MDGPMVRSLAVCARPQSERVFFSLLLFCSPFIGEKTRTVCVCMYVQD